MRKTELLITSAKSPATMTLDDPGICGLCEWREREETTDFSEHSRKIKQLQTYHERPAPSDPQAGGVLQALLAAASFRLHCSVTSARILPVPCSSASIQDQEDHLLFLLLALQIRRVIRKGFAGSLHPPLHWCWQAAIAYGLPGRNFLRFCGPGNRKSRPFCAGRSSPSQST